MDTDDDESDDEGDDKDDDKDDDDVNSGSDHVDEEEKNVTPKKMPSKANRTASTNGFDTHKTQQGRI